MENAVTLGTLVDSGLVMKCPGCGEHSSASRGLVTHKDSPMSARYEKGEVAPIRHASLEAWECGHCQVLNLKDNWYEPVVKDGHTLTVRQSY